MSKALRDKEGTARSKRRVIQYSIATASSLCVFKLAVGVMSQSMAVMASAIDSLLDVLASTVNFISLREASKPADREHAYGHGKIESLAGLFQSVLISGSGLFLIYESCRRLIWGETISRIGIAIVVMVTSAIATFFLVRQLKSVASKTGSLIVGTDALHFTTDLITNAGVIVVLLLVQWTGAAWWDLVVAIGISVYILWQAFGIMRTAIDELIDRALPEEIQKEIKKLVLNFNSHIHGLHDFRTRKIGNRKFIDFHITIEKSISFEKAHNLTEDVIKEIRNRYPDSDVNVHFDPVEKS